jgi:hypothetical protein
MNKIDETINEAKEKLDSPFWGKFIISVILWNWNFFYKLFFIDQEIIWDKFSQLRIDYALPGYQWWEYILHFIAYPFGSVLFLIYAFPFLEKKMYKKHEEDKAEKREIKIKAETKISKVKLEKEKVETEISVEKSKQLKNKEKKREILEKEWDKEYKEIIKSDIISEYLKFMAEILFLKRTNDLIGYRSNETCIRRALAKIEEIDLCSNWYVDVEPSILDKDIISSHIKKEWITEKGEYFARKYYKENMK